MHHHRHFLFLSLAEQALLCLFSTSSSTRPQPPAAGCETPHLCTFTSQSNSSPSRTKNPGVSNPPSTTSHPTRKQSVSSSPRAQHAPPRHAMATPRFKDTNRLLQHHPSSRINRGRMPTAN
ncbi:hypothetical protein QBC39DRAFT_182037 [Podospora conica]|nr:hypothetical protein QBC39DRAFT_182037 [Schizothecium conicum]